MYSFTSGYFPLHSSVTFIILSTVSSMVKLSTSLTPFEMGGGHYGPPKMFLTTVLKRLGGGS